MAESADLSRAIALMKKGMEVSMKGHDARAAEKFAFAAEEAERVYVFCGSPDCIFIAALRSMQVTALLDYSNASTALPADKRNAFRKAVKVLPGIMNRYSASTLRARCCLAHVRRPRSRGLQHTHDIALCLMASSGQMLMLS